jgi:hypothetical protein
VRRLGRARFVKVWSGIHCRRHIKARAALDRAVAEKVIEAKKDGSQ